MFYYPTQNSKKFEELHGITWTIHQTGKCTPCTENEHSECSVLINDSNLRGHLTSFLRLALEILNVKDVGLGTIRESSGAK